MSNRTRFVLALSSMALAACATPPTTAVQWGTPKEPLPDYPQPTHAEKLANPPSAFVLYEDYNEEPTRFIFQPRPPIVDENGNNTADNGDTGDYGYEDNGFLDLSGGVLRGGPPGGR